MKSRFSLIFFSPADNRPPAEGSQEEMPVRWAPFSKREKQFLRDNWQKLTNEEIARKLGRTRFSIASQGHELGLKRSRHAFIKARMKGLQKRSNIYTNAEKQFLRDNWQTMTIAELAQKLGRSYGSVKSMGQKKMGLRKTQDAIRQLAKRANAGQFKKGHLPPNTVYGDESVIRIRHSKKGPSYKYIRTGFRQWQEYHRWLWIKHNGPVPARHVVSFINGDQMDVRLENLQLITMQENSRRNAAWAKLTDGYVANTIAWRDSELKQELLKHPELIELKRQEIQLRRTIKQQES